MTPPTDGPVLRGTAVLRDYPLRLWAEQQEHFDALMREFQLLLAGQESGMSSAPRMLVDLADMFTSRFGQLLQAITEERTAALACGRDRMDSQIPLVEGTPELLDHVRRVLEAVDAYCRSGDMLVLPRSAVQVALFEWTRAQLVAQYEGARPTPWPGPFA
jgi:hypothetical protein